MNSLSTFQVKTSISTEEYTYIYKESIESTFNIIYCIYHQRGIEYLVKTYLDPVSEPEIAREKMNTLCLSQVSSLSLIPFDYYNIDQISIIYKLDNFTCLSKLLSLNKDLNKEALTLNIIDAVQKVHSTVKLVHSCINLETILVNQNLDVKIIGFENSLKFEELNISQEDIKNRIHLQEKCFKAPEVLNSGYEIGKKADIWSLGVVIFKIYYREVDLNSLDDEKQLVLLRYNHDEKLRRMFELVFCVDPYLRVDLKTLKNVLILNPPKRSLKEIDRELPLSEIVKKIVNDEKKEIDARLIDLFLEKAKVNLDIGTIDFLNSLKKRTFKTPVKVLKCLFLLETFMFTLKNISMHEYGGLIENLTRISENFSKYHNDYIQEYINYIVFKNDIHYSSMNSAMPNDDVDSGTYSKSSTRLILNPAVHLDDSLSKLKMMKKFILNTLALNEYKEVTNDIIKLTFTEILATFHKLLNDIPDKPFLQNLLKIRYKVLKILSSIYRKDPYFYISYSTPYYNVAPHNLRTPIHGICSYKVKRSIPINFSSLTLSRNKLGRGSQSEVFEGSYYSKPVAVKIFNSLQDLRAFNREVNSLLHINHKNIIKYIASSINPIDKQYYLILEYCSGGNISDTIIKNKNIPFTDKQKLKIALDIAEGLKYLHNLNPPIMHRDLKLSNLLLEKAITKNTDIPLAKISDFGLSRFYENERVTLKIGLKYWMAPEIIRGSDYTTKCDVYSFGVTLWEIFTWSNPIDEGLDISKLNDSFAELKNLVSDCLSFEPAARPDLKELVERLREINLNYSI